LVGGYRPLQLLVCRAFGPPVVSLSGAIAPSVSRRCAPPVSRGLSPSPVVG